MSHLGKTINIIIGISALNIISAVRGIKKPYQNFFQDFQETFIMMNLTGLYVFALTEWWIANEILVFIAGFVFSLVIMHRIVNQLCARNWLNLKVKRLLA